MKFGVIAAILCLFLIWLVSHSRLILHGGTLIFGLIVIAFIIWAASHYARK